MVLVAMVVASAAVWRERVELLTWSLHRVLAEYGLRQAEFTVDRLDLHGLVLHDVRLRGGAAEAAALTVAYSPLGLAAAHLERLEVAGLHAALTVDNGTLLLGGEPLDFDLSSGGGGIDAIDVADARLTVESGAGRYAAVFAGTGALAGGRFEAAALTADLTAQIDKAHYDAHLTASKVEVASANGGLAADFTDAAVSLPNSAWSADGIRGTATWRAGQGTVDIASVRLSQHENPPVVRPIGVSGRATTVGEAVDYTLHLNVTPALGHDALAVDITGRYDLASNGGAAKIAALPVVFAPGGLQPHDFFPRWSPGVDRFGGSVAVSGSMRWQGGKRTSEILVHLTDGVFESDAAQITHAEGDLTFVDVLSPATPPAQTLVGVLEVPGLPPSRAMLRFQLRPDSSLAVEEASFEFAQGRIATSPFVIDPIGAKIETVLDVDQLDLSEILQLVRIQGVTGTGRIDGRIPLKLTDGRVRIDRTTLAASGPGVLSVKSDKLPAAITGAGENMTLVLQVLEDFHYDTLSLQLAETEAGEGTALLVLHGANPAVLGGQPFNFNIKLESNFDRLTDFALHGITMTRELLRRAERRLE